jgi:ribonuclease BN (tRNA processing enzyme)
MQLQCLGTAGYHPNEDRHTSCYFLPQAGIVLDAGTGLFRLAERIQTPTLDILLSHAHLDHIAGLTFLLDVLYRRPVDRLRIWGERKKLDAIREHLFADLVFPVAIDAQWCAIDEQDSFRIGDIEVSWRQQSHPGGSVGYRLDWLATDSPAAKTPVEETARTNRDGSETASPTGKRLLYLTDTTGEDSEQAIDWNRGASLMMHECYFASAQADWAEKTGHTSAGELAKIARRSSPRRLLLTHVNPLESQPRTLLEEVRSELGDCPIDVDLAADGLAIEF